MYETPNFINGTSINGIFIGEEFPLDVINMLTLLEKKKKTQIHNYSMQ